MNDIKTSTLLALAAAALVTAACDPYPKAPGGTPAVLRAVASGGNIEQVDGPFANPNAIVVDDAPLDALFFVWFTKEMDGASIQAEPDVDPVTGVAAADPCNLAGSPLTTSGAFPAGTTLCYASGSAQGGGLIEISPGFFWDVGSYSVGGTVRDSTGAPLQFNATFNVTHKPVLLAPDGYTVDVAWANDPTATGFTIERAEDAAGPWTEVVASTPWAEPGTTGNNEIYRDGALVPGSIYFYRVTPVGTAAPAPSTVTEVHMPGVPNVTARANPIVGTAPAADTVQLSIARIRGADYRVEQTTDVASATPTWTAATGPMVTSTGAALTNPITARATNPLVFNLSGLTNGTSYKFRIVPVFGGVDGTPTNASATVTIANP